MTSQHQSGKRYPVDHRPPSTFVDRPRISHIQTRSGKLKPVLVNLTDVGYGFEVDDVVDTSSHRTPSTDRGPSQRSIPDTNTAFDASYPSSSVSRPSTTGTMGANSVGSDQLRRALARTIRFVVVFKPVPDEEAP